MKPSLLLVDDDAIFRERLAKALTARGYALTSAVDGDQALVAARSARFSGAIIDLKMPGITGLDLLRELKSIDSELPVVVLTGYGSIATAIEAVRMGARNYLTKPVNPDHLLAALSGAPSPPEGTAPPPPEVPTLDRVEWEHIQRVLTQCSGNISQTARLLGLDRRSLQRKLAKNPPRN